VGRTTGRTLGIVIAVNVPTSFDGRRYIESIAIEPVDKYTEFSQGGDSGSVIVNKENKVVGLLMGGRYFDKSKGEKPTPDYPDRTYACNIHNVLAALNISIYSPPIAQIAYTLLGDGMSAPLSVQFSAVNSTDNDGTTLAYMWRMGDPKDNGMMTTSTGPDLTYQFNVPGTYEVTLTVMDEHGMSDRTAIQINVAMPAFGDTSGGAVLAGSDINSRQQDKTGLEILEDYFKNTTAGSEIGFLADTIKTEVLHLVNHNRKVTLAWRRRLGPSFLAQFLKSTETPGSLLVKEINGTTLQSLLRAMAVVLEEEGSISLRDAVQKYSLSILNAVNEHDTVEALMASLDVKSIR
jgi:PKD repeat protein